MVLRVRALKAMTSLLAAALGPLSAGTAAAESVNGSSTSVPTGSAILLDGKLGPAEWDDAKSVGPAGSDRIYVKRDASYLYVAIRFAPTEAASVDLYFDCGEASGKVLDLPASARLGEREGSFDHWPEWVWWSNYGWAANIARASSFQPPELLGDEAKEFQSAVTRLTARVWLSVDIQTKSGTRVLPLDGAARHTRRWIELAL